MKYCVQVLEFTKFSLKDIETKRQFLKIIKSCSENFKTCKRSKFGYLEFFQKRKKNYFLYYYAEESKISATTLPSKLFPQKLQQC